MSWQRVKKWKRYYVVSKIVKGEPDEKGEVEIGYGTYTDFQGRGFMTEAVGTIAKWALDQPGVNAVLAETGKENIASHKTLSKNNFCICNEAGNMLWWRLNKGY